MPSTEPDVMALLACPFCGASPFVRQVRTDWSPFTGWAVECMACHAVTTAKMTKEEAVELWSLRSAVPTPEGPVVVVHKYDCQRCGARRFLCIDCAAYGDHDPRR